MILSFGDRATEDLFHGGARSARHRFPPDVARTALRKLDMLNAASLLTDLGSPPGNRLEALRGDLRGMHSIRVNAQYRLVFRWTSDGPCDVRLLDYH